jgi:hypothetical protein
MTKQPPTRAYTKDEIERYLAPAGGYLRKDLEAMGVTWLPMKGWKRRLMDLRFAHTLGRLWEFASDFFIQVGWQIPEFEEPLLHLR